jgi:guanosine-3',5'-bis(diphosphate) 3'-pyrophosphohydrolase
MRQIERERSKDIGRELLDKEFRRFGTSLVKEIKALSVDKVLKEKHCANLDEALALIGYGKLDARSFVELCLPEEKKATLPEHRKSRILELFQKVARRGSDGIKVEGIDDVLVHYARCCCPVKGDPIIGFVTRGRGVTIHRRNCPKILGLDVDRRINVTWVQEAQTVRPISITVVTDDRGGMLTELSSVFARMNINISEAKCRGMGDGLAINTFKCGIVDLEQLKQVMRKLGMLKGIHRIERTSSGD